jgi:hypothetical protein
MFARASDSPAHAAHRIEIDRIAVPSRDRHESAGDRAQPRQSEDVDTTADGKIRGHGLTFRRPFRAVEPRRAPPTLLYYLSHENVPSNKIIV